MTRFRELLDQLPPDAHLPVRFIRGQLDADDRDREKKEAEDRRRPERGEEGR